MWRLNRRPCWDVWHARQCEHWTFWWPAPCHELSVASSAALDPVHGCVASPTDDAQIHTYTRHVITSASNDPLPSYCDWQWLLPIVGQSKWFYTRPHLDGHPQTQTPLWGCCTPYIYDEQLLSVTVECRQNPTRRTCILILRVAQAAKTFIMSNWLMHVITLCCGARAKRPVNNISLFEVCVTSNDTWDQGVTWVRRRGDWRVQLGREAEINIWQYGRWYFRL